MDRGQGFIQSPPTAFQGRRGQIENVRAANPRGGGAGELPREQIDQSSELALGPSAFQRVGQRGQGVDKEDVASVESGT